MPTESLGLQQEQPTELLQQAEPEPELQREQQTELEPEPEPRQNEAGSEPESQQRALDQLGHVPHRVQMPGKGCGLYALGMLLDYWHGVDPASTTALVCDNDMLRRRLDKAIYSVCPTTDRRLLDVAAEHGWSTAEGTVYVLDHMRLLAREFGYDGKRHTVRSVQALCDILSRGHPLLVAFDVDIWSGEPIESGGKTGHVAIITGFFKRADGSRFFTATHSQAGRRTYEWPAEKLLASMTGMCTTTKARQGDLPHATLKHLRVSQESLRVTVDPTAQLSSDPQEVLKRCNGLHGQQLELSDAGGIRLTAQAELDISLCLAATAIEIFPMGHCNTGCCSCLSREGYQNPFSTAPDKTVAQRRAPTRRDPPRLSKGPPAPPPPPPPPPPPRRAQLQSETNSTQACTHPFGVTNIHPVPSQTELRHGAPGLCCLAVPRRVQLGDVGCGLYALGMLMDYWHLQHTHNHGFVSAESAASEAAQTDQSSTSADSRDGTAAALSTTVQVALVKPMDSTVGSQNTTHFSVQPNTSELLLHVSQKLGFTRYGETYAAVHLCEVARHFGYSTQLHKMASLRTLIDLIDKGHPPIVCVDIDLTTFQPAEHLRGQHTHWVVVEGYFGVPSPNESSACAEDSTSSGQTGDEELHQPPLPQFLLVKQSGSRAPTPTVWSLEAFQASWSGNGWDGRYRKRAMPREVANRISLCCADGSSCDELDSNGTSGEGAVAVRLDSSRPALSEQESAEIWERGINLGILESAQVSDHDGDSTETPSTVPGYELAQACVLARASCCFARTFTRLSKSQCAACRRKVATPRHGVGTLYCRDMAYTRSVQGDGGVRELNRDASNSFESLNSFLVPMLACSQSPVPAACPPWKENPSSATSKRLCSNASVRDRNA